ncbi:MAG: ion transporter, partial [Alphaproteobacteria bacterium]|nr:ion transporter [Alphaproteobacteria bacterium]
GWAKEIVGPLMAYNPASLYLVLPYLLVTAFAVLNLVIAVLVDAVERSREEARAAALVEELDELEDLDRQILRELRDLRADIGKLR